MTIIEKIKQSVEGATFMPFLYHAAGEINELIARCKELPVAYSFLIDSGTIDDVNGRYHERVTIAVMFCDKTEFDFNAIENEEIIDRMKVKAYKWLQSLRMSNTLRIVSINSTQRLYDNTTDVLTGFAVNITIEDIAGVGECELPDVVFEIKDNGEYPVVGIDKVIVSVPNSLTDLVATENDKEYLPSDYGAYGFGKVKTQLPKIDYANIQLNSACFKDSIWAGDKYVGKIYSLYRFCFNVRNVEGGLIVDTRGWDLSNCTTIDSVFVDSSPLTIIGIEDWDMSGITRVTSERPFLSAFQSCDMRRMGIIDLHKWNVSGINLRGFCQNTRIELLNMENWDVKNNPDFKLMFSNFYGKLNIVGWEMSNLATSNWCSGTYTTSLVGDYTIDEVINRNLATYIGVKISITKVSPSLERASLRAIINGLADLTGQTAQTLTLGATLMAKLTEEDIAIATSKNWTIA